MNHRKTLISSPAFLKICQRPRNEKPVMVKSNFIKFITWTELFHVRVFIKDAFMQFKTLFFTSLLLTFSGCQNSSHLDSNVTAKFNPTTDMIILNYDHAADKDDGHSAAADRTILQSLYGKKWVSKHVVAVSGATGTNAKRFVPASDNVMNAVWNDLCGWIAANNDRQNAVKQLEKRWTKTLNACGDIWIKEGGQSDITAAVVKKIKENLTKIDTTKRIHVVQHSDWNEKHTTHDALAYTKAYTDYIRIPDANPYLRSFSNNQAFAESAIANPTFGKIWRASFDYFPPAKRLDFSDTGELMHILKLGQINLQDFQTRFLK